MARQLVVSLIFLRIGHVSYVDLEADTEQSLDEAQIFREWKYQFRMCDGIHDIPNRLMASCNGIERGDPNERGIEVLPKSQYGRHSEVLGNNHIEMVLVSVLNQMDDFRMLELSFHQQMPNPEESPSELYKPNVVFFIFSDVPLTIHDLVCPAPVYLGHIRIISRQGVRGEQRNAMPPRYQSIYHGAVYDLVALGRRWEHRENAGCFTLGNHFDNLKQNNTLEH